MTLIRHWFNHLSRKEQRMVVIGGILLLFVCLYHVIWFPAVNSVEQLRVQNQVSGETLSRVQQLVTEYQQLKGNSNIEHGDKVNITSLVNTTVAHHKLQVKRMQASAKGSVQVRFENVVFNRLIAWLDQMESRGEVTLGSVSINQTHSPGRVNALIQLKKIGV